MILFTNLFRKNQVKRLKTLNFNFVTWSCLPFPLATVKWREILTQTILLRQRLDKMPTTPVTKAFSHSVLKKPGSFKPHYYCFGKRVTSRHSWNQTMKILNKCRNEAQGLILPLTLPNQKPNSLARNIKKKNIHYS